jgi:2-polyprenyl-3-methyl-5-hydroxy-6-metoxy-1,4-benzoquinol methylase
MGDKSLASHYEEFYEKASTIPQQADAAEVALFADLLPGKTPLRVLDVGCAEGRLALELARRGHRVTAADISRRQLDKVAEEARAAGLPLATVKCDIEAGTGAFGADPAQAPAQALFDAVYLMDVIEHFKNPVSALAHIRSLLADEGRLFINTPNVFTPARLLYYLLRPRKLIDYRSRHRVWDFHFQTYDYMTLEKTLAFIGFRTERVVPTRVTVPRLFSSRRLARLFPFLGDSLLLECRKAEPIDVDGQIAFWEESLLRARGKAGG